MTTTAMPIDSRDAFQTDLERTDTMQPPSSSVAVDDISRRAYERFLERGGEHGHDIDDWLEAERELSESQPV